MKKAILIALLGFGVLSAKAQVKPDPDTTAKHFLTLASIGNLQEVSAGQLALQKAILADVKAFGKMMITDHQQAEIKVMELAKANGYALPQAATGGIQPDLKLKKATTDFDRLYVHAMVVNHRNTVEMFEEYIIMGKDPKVKAFAQQTLPTLKAHLNAILALDEKIKDQVAQ